MNTVIIVQARMSSTRLPGKILMQVLGKPLLAYLVERLRRVRLADQIVIATTTNDSDLPVVALCEQLQLDCVRGPEHDVLARYDLAARAHGADLVVRVTSDCPLLDPAVVDDAIALYREGGVDYVSNALRPGYPLGMAVEVLPADLLARAAAEASAPEEREHVTPYIYLRPARFRIGHLAGETEYGRERWTVDTPEDFELVRRILEAIYPATPAFTLHDVLALLDRHPDWRHINAGVPQKTLGQ